MKTKTRVAAAALLALASCTGNRSSFVGTGKNRVNATPITLETAAERYWSAKVAEDWDSVFDLEYEPVARAQLVKSEFKDWSAKNEPFQIHSYQLSRTACDGDLGWVELNYVTSIRRFTTIPARDARMVQKWRLTDGAWYPVPKDQLDAYPEAPFHRDLAAEQILRERFLGSWAARKTKDWTGLYHNFTDPRDHQDVTVNMFAEAEGLFEYLDVDVRWVEVIGDFGKVRVTYRHKVTDKSMEKLAARDATIVERWVKNDNEWYRDLKWK